MTKEIFAILFFLIIVAQVVLANSMVSKGRQMKDLSRQKEELQSELLQLENRIAQASSLAVIRAQAEKLGMKRGKLHFLPPQPVAFAPKR